MAISQVAAISALEDLSTEITRTFTMSRPWFDDVIDGGNLEKLQGPYATFTITPHGPGYVQSHKQGDELLTGGAKEGSVKGTEYVGFASYTFDVSEKQIRQLGGKQDLVKLLADYPDNAITEFKELIAKAVIHGGVPGLDVFATFNGLKTYDPEGIGARTGLFEAAAPQSQTATVHGIQKNAVLNWHHQYGHIGSFASEGTSVMRQVIYTAHQQGASMEGSGIKQILADPQSFYNYVTTMDNRVIAMDRPQPDRNKSNPRVGLPFLETGANIHPEPYINIADMTGDMAEGVMYCLDPSGFRFFTQVGNYDGLALNEGWFDKKGPEWTLQQLVYRTVLTVTFNWYCYKLRQQALITGGANP